MIQSHVIDVDGVFVGAAVRLDTGYRFVATDCRLEQLDSTVWPTLADVRRLARSLYLDGRFVGPGAAGTRTSRALRQPDVGHDPADGDGDAGRCAA
jgi:hypothetical protein